MSSMRRSLAAACAAALLLPAGSAQAAAPPKGKYDCVIGASSTLFGTLTIKSGKKYTHRGTKGTFRANGRKLRFRRGTLGGMRGRWYVATGGTPEIALRNPRDDFESIYCTKA